MTTVCILMMIQTGQNVIKTLESAQIIHTFILLDIGMTKEELDEIIRWVVEHKKKLHIKKTKFVNFEETRNELLSYADSISKEEWFLLLDTEEELVGNIETLDEILNKARLSAYDGILFKQVHKLQDKVQKKYACKCIKARAGWKYKGVVGEFLEKEKSSIIKAYKLDEDAPHIYSNNTHIDLEREYKILLTEVHKNPSEPRNVFNLARVCEALKSLDEADKYYKIRIQQGGFYEELFHSFLSLGMIHKFLNHRQTAINYFLEAYEVEERVEPLLEIASIYIETKEWYKAFLFLDMATTLKEPKSAERQIYVDSEKYTYLRWHLSGIVSYYAGEFEAGENACKKAINKSKTKEDRELNHKNLKFYQNRNLLNSLN